MGRRGPEPPSNPVRFKHTVARIVFSNAILQNHGQVFLREDERYWYHFKFKILPKDHPNPTTGDGYFYPLGDGVLSAAWSCSSDREPDECRFD
jgi:hypothetical protein